MIKTNSASIQNKSIDSVGDCKDNTKAFAFLVPEDSEIINSRAVEAAQCTNSKVKRHITLLNFISIEVLGKNVFS